MKIENETDAIESLKLIYPLLKEADYTNLETLKTPILEAIAKS